MQIEYGSIEYGGLPVKPVVLHQMNQRPFPWVRLMSDILSAGKWLELRLWRPSRSDPPRCGALHAARVDDDLLLAVDDRQEPVVVKGPDIPCPQPAVRTNRFGRLCWLSPIAAHDDRARHFDLTVSGEPDADPSLPQP